MKRKKKKSYNKLHIFQEDFVLCSQNGKQKCNILLKLIISIRKYTFFPFEFVCKLPSQLWAMLGSVQKGMVLPIFSILHWEESFLLTSLANNAIHGVILKSYWKNEGKNTHSTFHCFIFKTVIKERNHLQFVFCITWLEPQKVQISHAVLARQTRPAVGMQIIHWHYRDQ